MLFISHNILKNLKSNWPIHKALPKFIFRMSLYIEPNLDKEDPFQKLLGQIKSANHGRSILKDYTGKSGFICRLAFTCNY